MASTDGEQALIDLHGIRRPDHGPACAVALHVSCYGRDGARDGVTSLCMPQPVQGVGPGGCATTYTAEVDGVDALDQYPQRAGTGGGDGLGTRFWTRLSALLTDHLFGCGQTATVSATASRAQRCLRQPRHAGDPQLLLSTDGGAFDDGEEDTNFNGVLVDWCKQSLLEERFR